MMSYSAKITKYCLVGLLGLFVNLNSFAEGSKELAANGGHRAYLRPWGGTFSTEGLVRVYAKVGEKIYVGSSAQGVNGGTTYLRAPDGTLYNTGASTTVGRISDRAEELAGPKYNVIPEPNPTGYTPATFTVGAGQEGIWSVFFMGSTGGTSSPPNEIVANGNWDPLPDKSGDVAAFDVSVRKDDAISPFINGRAYLNVFTGALNSFAGQFNGIFHVLTNDGYNYEVKANGLAGHEFVFFSNNKGYKKADGTASYLSQNSNSTTNLQDPRASDNDTDITHKLFFNTPAADLPASASIRSNNGRYNDAGMSTTTWLKTTPVLPAISAVSFVGTEGTADLAGTAPLGGYIQFTSNQTGTYNITIDVNNNGADARDVTLTGNAIVGLNKIYWNGLDALGVKVHGTVNATGIKVLLKAGEVHFPFIDVENNVGGITITRQEDGSNIIYWDDRNISFGADGTPSSPLTQLAGVNSAINGHKWGRATGTETVLSNEFGDNKGLDTWAYLQSATLSPSASVELREGDLEVVSVFRSKADLCVGDQQTYTIVVRNNGPDDVTGANFRLTYPTELTGVSEVSVVTTGTAGLTSSSVSPTQYNGFLNMNNGSTATFTIRGTVSAKPASGSLNVTASIIRPPDFTDPNATNPDAAAPTDPLAECNSAPSGVGCNNIITNATPVASSNISIASTTISETSTGGTRNMNFTVSLSAVNPGCPITLDYALTHITTSAADFTGPTAGQVTIPAGQSSVDITIPVLADKVIENDETFTITIAMAAGSTGGQIVTGTATGTINDDDNAVINARVFSDGAEPATNPQIEVYFPTGVSSSVLTTVKYAVGGSATSNVDYTALSGTIDIPVGVNSVMIPVPVIDDKLIEGDETVTITLTSVVSTIPINVSAGNVAVKIVDDDWAFHRIELLKVRDGAEGGVNPQFTIGFPAGYSTSEPTTVTYTIGGSAINGTDYAPITGSIVIPAGTTTMPVDIAVVDDNIIEDTENVTLLLTSAKNGLPGTVPYGPATAVEATIADNDDGTLSISNWGGGAEPGTNGFFRISFPIGMISTSPTIINYTIGGNAINGTDYAALSGVVTLLPNTNYVDVPITVFDDLIIEGDENASMRLTAANNGAGLVFTVDGTIRTITIADNDNTGPNNFITLTKIADGAEPATNARFKVSFPVGVTSSQPSVINYVVGGTAIPGVDYTALSGTVTIPAGNNSEFIPVPVLDDLLSELTETVIITITSATNSVSALNFTPANPVSANIIDDENIGPNNVIKITKINDGAEPGTDALFRVSFPGTITSSVETTVSYVITGTASNGTDYTTLNGTIKILAGNNYVDIPVEVIDDNIIEGTETVALRLTNATNSISILTWNTATIVADILDDDNVAPKNIVTLSKIQDGYEGGSNVQYRVSFPAGITSSRPTTISYSVSGSAINGTDYGFLNGTIDISAGANSALIDIAVVDDLIIEGDESISLILTGAANSVSNISIAPNTPIAATIYDNDNTAPAVTLAVFRDGAEGGVNPQFKVSFPGSVTSSVDTKIDYIITGTAINGIDYTAISGTVTIPAGFNSRDIDILVNDDLIIEGNETVSLTIIAVTNDVSPSMVFNPVTAVTATIFDNDNVAPKNIVTLTKLQDGAEPGTNVKFLLSFPAGITSAAITKVKYSIAGTATNGIDYDTLNGTVDIPIGANSVIIDIPVIDDYIIESNETIVLALTSADNDLSPIIVNPISQITATIADDDNTAANNVITLSKVADGAEPTTNAQFKVSFPGVISSAVDTRVDYTISGTAINGTDYETINGFVIIPAGNNEEIINIKVKDDLIIEGNETVSLRLINATNTLSAGLLTVVPATPVTAIIADNDNVTPNNIITLTREVNGDETGPVAVKFKVSFPAGITSSEPTTVNYSIAGSALNGTDYAFLNGVVVIKAGDNFADIIATVIDDQIIEGTETIDITLNSATNPVTSLTVNPTTFVRADLLDNDNIPPNNNVTLTKIVDGSEPGTNGQFKVSFPLGITSSVETELKYNISGTAIPGTDYKPLSGTVKISAGANFAYIDVEVLDDAIIEGTETVDITLTSIANSVAGLTFSPITPVSVNILDDELDPMNPANIITLIKVADGREPGTNAVYKVSYPPGVTATQSTTITYTFAGGTAQNGIDYEALTGTVVIPENTNSALFQVIVKDDKIIEPTETVQVTLTGANNTLFPLITTPATAVIAYIEDDDNVPPNNVVSIKSVIHAGEPTANGRFVIGFPAGVTSSVATTVNYAITGTGTQGVDYQLMIGGVVVAGPMVIPAGTTEINVDIVVNDDKIIEGTETVGLTLTGAFSTVTNPTIDPNTVIANITDDDNTPANNTITLIWVEDGAESAAPDIARFRVSFPPTYTTTVDTEVRYTVAGTATNGVDYELLTGIVTIPAGSNSATIDVVNIVDDLIIEGTETVDLTLVSATNTLVNVLNVTPNTPVSASIADNDTNIPIVLSKVSDGAEPGTNPRFRIGYPAGYTNSVSSTVTYTVAGTATQGTDYSDIGTSITIPAGVNEVFIDVPVFDDKLIEITETVILRLTSATTANPLVAGPVIANIDDNDAGNNKISIVKISDGAEPGTKAIFRVSYPDGYMAENPTRVDFNHIGGTATPGVDFIAPLAFVNIPALTNAALIEIDPIDDKLIEVTETIQLTVTAADNGLGLPMTLDPALAIANIEDDDNLPTVNNNIKIEVVRNGAEPGGGANNLQFKISFPAGVTSTENTDIRFVANGLAIAGVDYIAPISPVTIPAGDNSVLIDIPVIDDFIIENAETVVLTIVQATSTISNPVIAVSTATATIADNDNAPINTTINLEKVADGAEPGTNARFRVHFPDVFPYVTTVDTRIVYTIGGTATNDVDYNNLTGVVVIPAGSHEAFIDIIVKDDKIIEGVEKVELTLNSVTNTLSGTLPFMPSAPVIADIDDDDDDGPPQLSIIGIANGTEDGINGQFRVAFPAGYTSSVPTRIDYVIRNTAVDAINGADYQPITHTVIIPANQNSALIDIQVIDDDVIEGTEPVVLTVTTITNAVVNGLIANPASASINIQDNDLGTVTIEPVSVVEGNGGWTTARFKITKSKPTSLGIDINYIIKDGTAIVGEDYMLPVAPSPITIAGPVLETFIDVPVVGDLKIELNEQFTVELTGLSNNFGGRLTIVGSPATGTIIDDDNVAVNRNLTITSSNGVEGGADASFTFSFPPGVTADEATIISYTLTGVAEGSGVDYGNAKIGTVTIPAGQNSVMVLVPVVDDLALEGTENIIVTVNTVTNNRYPVINVDNSPHEFYIYDNENALLTLNGPVTIAEGDMGTTIANFDVVLNRPTGSNFSINYAITDGTAKASDSDYTAVNGALSFTGTVAGETRTISVVINGDRKIEKDETFTVTLSGLSNDFAGFLTVPVTSTIGTITNDDVAQVEITAINGAEEGPVKGSFRFGFPTGYSSDEPTVIHYSIDNTPPNVATAGVDYTGITAGTVTIPAGQNSVLLDFPVIDDGDIEGDEIIRLAITGFNSAYAAITLNPVVPDVIIVDNDQATLTLSGPVTVTEGDTGSTLLTYTVTLNQATIRPFSVNYATADGTATVADNDYSAAAGTLNFAGNAGESHSFTVLIKADRKIESDEYLTVALNTLTDNFNNQLAIAGLPITLTITNDDTGTITLTPTDGNEAGPVAGRFRFSFPAGITSDHDVVIQYALSGTAGATDYAATPAVSPIIIPAGQNSVDIDIAVVDDTLIEGTETVVLTTGAINPYYSSIVVNNSPQAVKIYDNDNATLTIGNATVTEGDSGTKNITFTVTLDNATGNPFNVAYSTADGTATIADNDYVAKTGVVNFSGTAGETQDITIQVNGDKNIEADETFNVILDALSNDFSGRLTVTVTPAVGTITNDDATVITVTAINGSETGPVKGIFKFSFPPGVVADRQTRINYTLIGTAIIGTDYTGSANSGSLIIPAGANSVSLDLPVIDDNLLETDETIVLDPTSLSIVVPYPGVTLNPVIPDIIITDNDQTTLTLSDPVRVLEPNTGTVTATFSVTLDKAVAAGFTIDYSTADGSATIVDNDYVATNGTLTFAGTAGESQTFTVTINGDVKLEGDEDYNVLLSNLSNTFGGRLTIVKPSAKGIILDDDLLSITITKQNGGEGTTPPSFTFSFSPGITSEVETIIPYTLAGTATGNNVDYRVPTSGNVIIPAGKESVTLTLTVVDDAITELTETVVLRTGVVSNSKAPGVIVWNSLPQTVTISDNDIAYVKISNPIIKKEGATGAVSAVFDVTLTGATESAFTVSYKTQDGTATVSDRDYQAVNAELAFVGNAGEVRPVTINILSDNKIEEDEMYTVILSALSKTFEGRLRIAGSPATGVILNDDVAPLAEDDVVETNEDTAIDINVIENDTDADGTIDPSGITIVIAPKNGTAVPNSNGTVTYTPAPDFNGTDEFTYTVNDNTGIPSNEANVTIVVHPVNDPPVAADKVYTMEQDGVLKECVCPLAKDPEGDPITFSKGTDPLHGTLNLLKNGDFTYTPESGYVGEDKFTYQVCDAFGACATATITIQVVPTTVVNLKAEATTVSEGRKTTVTATLARAFEEDVIVELAYEGVATKDTDYKLSGQYQKIRIPKGSLSTTEKVTITALLDDVQENDENVNVVIKTVSNTQVKIGNNAEVIIKDAPLDLSSDENTNITADPLLSPNGDGNGNEFFVIKNISSFPDNEVVILNRWGNEVYRQKGYEENEGDKVFKGFGNSGIFTNSKEPLPDGVYYYLIYTRSGTKTWLNKGYIIIKR